MNDRQENTQASNASLPIEHERGHSPLGAGRVDGGGMRAFSDLVSQLGTSTKTNAKLDALVNYFSSSANDRDKVWVIALFSGRRPKRAVNTTQLASWCVELIGLPFWLFEESYHTVGVVSCKSFKSSSN